jgi:hypothetical protein
MYSLNISKETSLISFESEEIPLFICGRISFPTAEQAEPLSSLKIDFAQIK